MTLTTPGPVPGSAMSPGAVVVVRDEEWIVTQVAQQGRHLLVTAQGVSELVRDTAAQFSTDLDTIEVVDPKQTRVVGDDSSGYLRARLWLEATLRKSPLPMDDPSLAVSGDMLADPLDYQRTAVRRALDPAILRPRILLADAVGLGKTLEIGMILAELVRRGRGERILVVTPRHVLEQTQHELWTRFALPFVRLDSLGIQRVRRQLPATRNPFSRYRRAIISIDTLKSDRYLNHLRKQRWDAVVIDESHNITNVATQNNRLAGVLAPTTDALILASATPHNGRRESFAELIRLLEPSAVSPTDDVDVDDIRRLVIRRHRHSPEVASYVGADWAERLPVTNRLIEASPLEDEIAAELSQRWLYPHGDEGAALDALFGWTLAKAYLSSPAALAETVRNRLTRAARSHERRSLERLRDLADAAAEEKNGKYGALLEEFARIGIARTGAARVVVFAERLATLDWLRRRVVADLRLTDDQVRVLHGRLSDIEQQEIVDSFKQAGSPIRVLITGDVASEGVNLHLQCHELIHYDIPWSLIRIEQRNGRIDRYGQREHPQITTLLLQPSDERFSGDVRVLRALMEKEEQAHRALGDSASLMGKYDVAAEEGEILKVLRGATALDDAVGSPDAVAQGHDWLATLAAMGSSWAQEETGTTGAGAAGSPWAGASTVEGAANAAQAGSGRPSLPSLPSADAAAPGLFASQIDYLRSAVHALYDRPEQAPRATAGGGIGWVEHPGHVVELVPPPDLRARLSVLPQSYLRQREVTQRLRLATTKSKATAVLRDALADETASSWPEAHYLGPLHPVLDWISDRALAVLGRGEVFAVRGSEPGESRHVLLMGTLTNRAGQTVARTWVQVEFPDPEKPTFGLARLHESAEAMVAAVGLTGDAGNPGPVAGAAGLAALIPAAVDNADEALDATFAAASRAAERQVGDWTGRIRGWEHEAETLISRREVVRAQRGQVAAEAALVDARMPARRSVRPLLVVVPADHPVQPRVAPQPSHGPSDGGSDARE